MKDVNLVWVIRGNLECIFIPPPKKKTKKKGEKKYPLPVLFVQVTQTT